jgi:DNA primase
MIPKAFIELVENKTDLAALIGGYIELLPRGKNFVGLCPFDGGTTTMLTISSDKKIWKCFKCGKGGRAIKFIMEMEQVTFPEAVCFLADKLKLKMAEGDA